jgi:TP901 family phage tail tape measure protein
MSDGSVVGIGGISASILLKYEALIADSAAVQATIKEMAASVQASITEMSSGVAASLESERIAAAAEASAAKVSASFAKIGTAAGVAGLAIAAGLGVAMKTGADFESMIMDVSNNTSMTTAQVGEMTDQVKRMGEESGAPMEQIATGFMKASNFGFNMADSVKIVNAAMRSAVATGGDVGKTTEIVANILHEFGMKAADAAHAMNLLHVEANKGNMTLEQMVEAGGPMFAMAANLGVSINDVASAMAALTQHGFNASRAATQVDNILAHIIKPSQQASAAIEDLSQKSGIDLVRDFSVAGLAGRGFYNVFQDIEKAAKLAGVSTSEAIIHIIPAMRGGQGAMALAGTAAKDWKDRLDDANAAMSGKLDPTTDQYNNRLKTFNARMKEVQNALIIASDDIGKVLAPQLLHLIDHVKSATDWFSKLDPQVKDSGVKFFELSAMIGLAAGALVKLAKGWQVLVDTGAAAVGALPVAALAAGGAAGIGIGADLSNTIGESNRELYAGANTKRVPGAYGNAKHQIALMQEQLATDMRYLKSKPGDSGVELPTNIREANIREKRAEVDDLTAAIKRLQDASKVTPALHHGSHPAHKAAGPGAYTGDGDDAKKGGGKGESDAEKAADALRDKLQDLKDAAKEANDELYKLTHSEGQVKQKELIEEYQKNRLNPFIGQQRALDIFTAGWTKNAKEMQQVSRDQYDKVLEAARATDDAMVQAYWAAAEAMDKADDARKESATASFAGIGQGFADMVAKIIATAIAAQEKLKRQYDPEKYGEEDKDRQKGYDQAGGPPKQTPYQKKMQDLKDTWDATISSMGNKGLDILGNSLMNGLQHHFKGLWKDILSGFTQMIEQMLIQWLELQAEMAIVKAIPGLGTFFGFDDPVNDTAANRFGRDFGSLFSSGAQDGASKAARLSGLPNGAGGRSSGGGDIHVHMHNPVIREPADIGRLARSVMAEANRQTQLRGPIAGKR